MACKNSSAIANDDADSRTRAVCFAKRARRKVSMAVRTDSHAAIKFCAQNEQHTAEQVEAQRDRRRHCELRARHTCEQQPAGRHGRPQTRASARVCQQCALSRLADGTLSSLLVSLVPGRRLVPLCGHTGGPPCSGAVSLLLPSHCRIERRPSRAPAVRRDLPTPVGNPVTGL